MACLHYFSTASFQWLLHATLPTNVRGEIGGTEPSTARMVTCIIINACLCTPIMVLQMSFFQLISGDAQGKHTMLLRSSTKLLHWNRVTAILYQENKFFNKYSNGTTLFLLSDYIFFYGSFYIWFNRDKESQYIHESSLSIIHNVASKSNKYTSECRTTQYKTISTANSWASIHYHLQYRLEWGYMRIRLNVSCMNRI